MKILVGRIQEQYLIEVGHIIYTEILFSVFCFLVKSKLLNIDLFLSKRGIIIPYINHKQSLHSYETEAFTMLRYRQCRDIERRLRNVSSYVYNRGCSYMVFTGTIMPWDILSDKTVTYIIS